MSIQYPENRAEMVTKDISPKIKASNTHCERTCEKLKCKKTTKLQYLFVPHRRKNILYWLTEYSTLLLIRQNSRVKFVEELIDISGRRICLTKRVVVLHQHVNWPVVMDDMIS